VDGLVVGALQAMEKIKLKKKKLFLILLVVLNSIDNQNQLGILKTVTVINNEVAS